MAKAKKKAPKKLILPDDKPVKLNMSFEEAIKRAATMPLPTKKEGKSKGI